VLPVVLVVILDALDRTGDAGFEGIEGGSLCHLDRHPPIQH
jgi:hypothetical protein